MDEIRLLRSTHVRAEKNPDVGTPYQVRAALIYASIPRRPSSWPLKATKKQSRVGLPSATTRIASSQQASRLPCSLAHCHQPLRGAMRTSGASVELRLAILTLKARAFLRLA